MHDLGLPLCCCISVSTSFFLVRRLFLETRDATVCCGKQSYVDERKERLNIKSKGYGKDRTLEMNAPCLNLDLGLNHQCYSPIPSIIVYVFLYPVFKRLQSVNQYYY